jgi:general secretion pathway protein B
MSLILDALKKSEAERQLGRAPGLTTPMPLRRGETQEHGRAWLRYAAWLAIAAALGACAWWLARRAPPDVAAVDDPPAVATRANPVAPVAAPPTSSAEPIALPAPTAAAPAVASVADHGATREQAPVATAAAAAPATPPHVVEAATPKPRDPEFDSVERETEAIVAPSPPPSSDNAPAPQQPQPVTAAATPVQAPPWATVAAIAEPAPAAAPPPRETLPRLDQLGGPQRDSLPPLKQTMHVYAEVPAARFVLIDGRRYREGDKLSGSLQLIEIRREGTVLQLDGLRFLLPRP